MCGIWEDKGASRKGWSIVAIIARVNHACGFGNMEGIPMILPILKSNMLIFFKLSLLLAVVVVMIVSVIGWGKQE